MATITYCDRCRKKQKDRKGWAKISIFAESIVKTKGLKHLLTNFELCDTCAEQAVAVILKMLNKKVKKTI